MTYNGQKIRRIYGKRELGSLVTYIIYADGTKMIMPLLMLAEGVTYE